MRNPVLLTTMVLALLLPAGAQAAVLHDQRGDLGFYSDPSDDYLSSMGQDNLDNQSADDFTVPPGQSWRLTQADLVGNSAGVPSIVNAWIYGTSGRIPGAELFHEAGVTATNQPNYAVPLTGSPALEPGTYWISVQQTAAFYVSATWAWNTRAHQEGNQAVFRNPGGAYVSDCLDWTPQKTCFTTAGPDLAWSISGNASSIPVTFGQETRNRKKGTALLTVTVPAAGTVQLGGKGVAGSSAQAAATKASSSLVLPIRATGKAKKKLKKRGKAKLNVTVTYTAPGAAPAPASLTVKLRKS